MKKVYKCGACQSEVTDSQKFCTSCGGQLSDAQEGFAVREIEKEMAEKGWEWKYTINTFEKKFNVPGIGEVTVGIRVQGRDWTDQKTQISQVGYSRGNEITFNLLMGSSMYQKQKRRINQNIRAYQNEKYVLDLFKNEPGYGKAV